MVMILLAFTIGVRIWLASRTNPGSEPDLQFIAEMSELKEQLIHAAEIEEQRRKQVKQRLLNERNLTKQSHGSGFVDELKLFEFDPNTIPPDSLRLMQLPGFVTENILRYRSAGGVFRKPEDIGKIYGMDPHLYEEILPYVFISKQLKVEKEMQILKSKVFSNNDSIPLININEADSAMLMMIPGIGPVYSGRIVRYRELLGGFHEEEQLMEVYGMDTSRYAMLVQFCRVDCTGIRRIDLNRASFRDLAAHPYLSRSETYAILHYRTYADSIVDTGELLHNQIIDQERFVKVSPYLTTKR